MVMETIQIRLTKELVEEADKLVKGGMYPSRSEFIRDVVRKFIQEREIDAILAKTFGVAKGKKTKPFTKEIREKIAREHTPEKARALMEKYGLKDFQEK